MGGEEQGARLTGSGGALASLLFMKIYPTLIPKTGRCQYLEENSGERGRDTETRRDPRQANPPGYDKYLSDSRGRQRGSAPMREITAYVGMRIGAQGRAAGAGRCQVRVALGWAELCAGRGGG